MITKESSFMCPFLVPRNENSKTNCSLSTLSMMSETSDDPVTTCNVNNLDEDVGNFRNNTFHCSL